MAFSKILAVLALLTIGYCQDHDHHTIFFQPFAKHEVPKKVEYNFDQSTEQKIVPVPVITHNQIDLEPPTPQLFGEVTIGPYDNLVSRKNIPVTPAPVHEVINEVAPIIQPHQQNFIIQQVAQPVQHYQPVQQHQSVQLHQPIQHHEPFHHHQVVQVAHEEPIHHIAPHTDHNEHHVEYYAYPKYEFEYKVDDPHTGDKKYQHESRDGDVVKGVYSLHEPDGSIRTVKYGSSKKTGFVAEVLHEGHSVHEQHHHH